MWEHLTNGSINYVLLMSRSFSLPTNGPLLRRFGYGIEQDIIFDEENYEWITSNVTHLIQHGETLDRYSDIFLPDYEVVLRAVAAPA